MASAFSAGQTLQRVSAVAKIYSNTIDRERMMPNSSYWLDALDEIANGIKQFLNSQCGSPRGVPEKPHGTADDDVLQALLHLFHQIHEAAVRHVTLPLDRWQHWKDGIGTCLWIFPLSKQNDTEITTSPSARLVAVQRRLLSQLQDRFQECFWGCSFTIAPRLTAVMRRWEEKRNHNQIDEKESEHAQQADPDHESEAQSVSQFEQHWFHELHTFHQLSKDAAHLFLEYPVIGKMEREVLTGAIPDDDEVLEPLLRSRFKRDFCVPSSDTETEITSSALWREYAEFEVDDKKEKELHKILQTTSRSALYKAMEAFYSHIRCRLSQERNKQERESEEEKKSMMRIGDLPFLDADDVGNKLADDVVQIWRATPENCYTALAFTMQRLLELEKYPSVLNPARLFFALHLLHQWWSWYIGRNHRWGVTSAVFAAQDDTDLWKFIVQRHEVLLRLAFVSQETNFNNKANEDEEHTKNLNSTTDTNGDRCLPHAYLDALNAVTQSLAHCLATYLAAMSGSVETMSATKAAYRRKNAVSICTEWVESFIVNEISVSLINSIYSYASSVVADETCSHNADIVEDDLVLYLEGRLKLILLDVYVALSRYSVSVQRKNQSRLIDMAKSILTHLEERGTAIPTDKQKPLFYTVLRLLQRAGNFLPLQVDPDGNPLVEDTAVFIHSVMGYFKRLTRIAAEILGSEEAVETVTDAWMTFSSHCVVVSPVSQWTDPSTEPSTSTIIRGNVSPSVPLSIPYEPLFRVKKGMAHGNNSGSSEPHLVAYNMMDVIIERRKRLKRVRSE